MLRETRRGEVAEGTAQTAPATRRPRPGNRASGRRGVFEPARPGPRDRRAGARQPRDPGPDRARGASCRASTATRAARASRTAAATSSATTRWPTELEPDNSIRVKPGPVRATLIKPGPAPRTKKQWLETALGQDPLLKELPNWAREKAIDGLKDIDETIAEKIIDALPWESGTKEAATAALKALLQTAKGKKFETPVAPPNPRVA